MAFRSILFSKVVPNLRKLGLLTPRVRDGFEQLGILRYERYIDSATEAGELDPTDLTAAEANDPFIAMRAQLGAVERIAPEPILMVLASMVDRSNVRDIPRSRIRLTVDGGEHDDGGDFVLTIGEGEVAYEPAGPDADARTDVQIGMTVETWTDIIAGRLSAPAAAIDGKVTVGGDVSKALALEALL
jgi:putative sterol carrier protein